MKTIEQLYEIIYNLRIKDQDLCKKKIEIDNKNHNINKWIDEKKTKIDLISDKDSIETICKKCYFDFDDFNHFYKTRFFGKHKKTKARLYLDFKKNECDKEIKQMLNKSYEIEKQIYLNNSKLINLFTSAFDMCIFFDIDYQDFILKYDKYQSIFSQIKLLHNKKQQKNSLKYLELNLTEDILYCDFCNFHDIDEEEYYLYDYDDLYDYLFCNYDYRYLSPDKYYDDKDFIISPTTLEEIIERYIDLQYSEIKLSNEFYEYYHYSIEYDNEEDE